MHQNYILVKGKKEQKNNNTFMYRPQIVIFLVRKLFYENLKKPVKHSRSSRGEVAPKSQKNSVKLEFFGQRQGNI